MSVITAYKSDEDGKIFEDKHKYQLHLRKLARHRLEQRKLQISEAEKDRVWAELYEREQSLEDWTQMVIDNQHLFWAEAAAGNPRDWERVGMKLGRGKNAGNLPMPEVLAINMRLQWNDNVSNSHSCPHNGVTNFDRRADYNKGRPTSYPGWSGRIEWVVKWPEEFDGIYIGSNLFARGTFRTGRQRANTGTGGGGGGHFNKEFNTYCQKPGYDFKLFAADWPGLYRYEMRKQWIAKENSDRQHVWRTLGGTGDLEQVVDVPIGWVAPSLEVA